MMVRNGKILTEAYYKPFDKDFMHRLYSSSKTYVSIAIGMLIGEGKIRLEDRISDLMPDLVQIEQHKWMQECTVEDALKMSVPMLTDTYFALDYKEWGILGAVAVFDKETAVAMMKEYYGAMLDKGATTFWEDFDISWAENSCRIDEFPKEGEKDIHGDFGAYCLRAFGIACATAGRLACFDL